MLFSVVCFIQASSLLTAFLAGVTFQDSWFAILIGTIAGLPMIWIYNMLISRFPGKNLLEILSEVFGKVLGKIFGVMYIWFFLTLTSLNTIDMGNFVKLTIMEETPRLILMVLCIVVGAWAIRYGIGVVSRYSFLFSMISFIILVIGIFLVWNQMDFKNFLPMFTLPVKEYIQGTNIILTIPFGELVVFLMIIPNVNIPPQKISKMFFIGYLLGGIHILVVMARDIAVLGNTIAMFSLPSLVTLRLVHLGEALSRMEILFAVVLIMLMFFKITFLYYVTVITIAQFFNLKEYKPLILSIGALILSYGLTLYVSPVKHTLSGQEIVPIFWILFEFLLPLVTLVTAAIRKRPKTGKV